MPASQLIIRLLSSIGKIDQTRMRSGNLTEDDWPRLSSAAQRLKDRPLFIDDTSGITPLEMRNRIKQFTRERVEQLRQQWHQEHGSDRTGRYGSDYQAGSAGHDYGRLSAVDERQQSG